MFLILLFCSIMPTEPVATPDLNPHPPARTVLKSFSGRASFYNEPQLTAWCNPPIGYQQFRKYRPHTEPVATAAHKTLPLGSLVRVHRLDNKLIDQVLISDRGPYVQGRVLDLCLKSAQRLKMINHGVVDVHCDVVRLGPQKEG